MTTAEPTYGQQGAAERAVFLNGLVGVLGTTGEKTTLVADKRAQRPLINANGKLQNAARNTTRSHGCTLASANAPNSRASSVLSSELSSSTIT